MNNTNFSKTFRKEMGIFLVLVTAIVLVASPAFGHGGREHAAGSFTSFQALQKATKLYDRLITSGKLGENWETDLLQVEISSRQNNGSKEFVVSFKRANGDPLAVYFFFSHDGKYAGSNFTGK